MADIVIQDAIESIRAFPYFNESSALIVRVLTKHASLFSGRSFQYSISMGVRLNVIINDGFHGIRSDWAPGKWFTLWPGRETLTLQVGERGCLLFERTAREENAGDLIREGTAEITGVDGAKHTSCD